jgi:hypothetical protein
MGRDESIDALRQIQANLRPEDLRYWMETGRALMLERASGPHLSVVASDTLPGTVSQFRRSTG